MNTLYTYIFCIILYCRTVRWIYLKVCD